ncbi:MAG: GGDEF domain-containing protein [Armatimonadetes bacterium]|nr:GGDEF domain-containing protein [Armatimonadota bacterium]
MSRTEPGPAAPPDLADAHVDADRSIAADAARPMVPRRELLLEESTQNEQTISLWRLAACLMVAAQAAARASFRTDLPDPTEWAQLTCMFAAVLYAAALFVAFSRRSQATWLSYVSVGMDVTLISCWLLSMVFTGDTLAAANSHVALPLYLLALALSGLRYNPRVTVFCAFLAAAEYALIIMTMVTLGDALNLSNPRITDQLVNYGQFDLLDQFTRLLLLVAGGVVATFGVRRARELRTAAIVDALTQVYNRGFLDERLHNEMSRAERYDREISVLLMDVDLFKQYNDRRGHQAGDQVLRELADILRYGLRGTDTVARYGGEEFVCLLPETGKEEAMRLADRLREQVAEHAFLHGHEQPTGAVTISIGVGTYPGDAGDVESLVRHADQALYRAKAAGRNRVEG